MRLGQVIGKVTLSQQEASYRGGRFLVVQPWAPAGQKPSPTVIVYDNLGAGLGHTIGFVEGSEAAKPFNEPTPVDAFNVAIADEVFHQPPK